VKTNTYVQNTIRKAHTVKALPRLTAEFNWNRYSIPTADNTPAHSVIARDPDFYPAEAMTRPNRPKRGHVKAQLDSMVLMNTYSPSPPAIRHHIAEDEDIYKYWSSPSMTENNVARVQTTNRATNPGFERAANTGTVERWRNYVLNPKAGTTTTGFLAIGSTPSTYTRVAGIGPVGTTTYFRATSTAVGQTMGAGSMTTVVQPGIYTASLYVRSGNMTTTNGSIYLQGTSTRTIMSQGNGTMTANGQWVRFWITVKVTAAGTVQVGMNPGPSTSVGQILDYGALSLTATPYLFPYFDGDMTNDSIDSPFGLDYSYNWSNQANLSETVVIGPVPTSTLFTNIVNNPRATSTAGYTGSWPGNTPNARTVASVASAQSVSGSAIRWSWTTKADNSGDFGVDLSGIGLVANTTYTVNYKIRSVDGGILSSPYAYPGAAGTMTRVAGSRNANKTFTAGEVESAWVTFIPDATAVVNSGRLLNNILSTGAQSWEIFDVIITATSVPIDYFDGIVGTGRWADPDFTPSWSGTANASSSRIRGVDARDTASQSGQGIQSFSNSTTGKKSVRVSTTQASLDSYVDVTAMLGGMAGLVDGKTYTALVRSYQSGPLTNPTGGNKPRAMWAVTTGAATNLNVSSTAGPNAAGYTDHRITFTMNTGATYKSIRLINGSAINGGDIWYDNFMLVEGNYTGSYFDGSNTPANTEEAYGWTGTAHTSMSTYSFVGNFFPVGAVYSSDANPQVTYDRVVNTNKIVIGLENSVHSPKRYSIHTQSALNGPWTKVADHTNTTIDSDGRIILYRGSSAWQQDRTLDYIVPLTGVQMRVESMVQPSAYLQVIELAALLEKDLSDYLVTTSDQFDLGDSNVLSPIGKISSNTASITLFNGLVDEDDFTKGLMFNQGNVNSPLYGLMKENVKFTLDYLYDASSYNGSTTEPVRQFVMFAEQDWGADLQESISVQLRDGSKFLQEIKCPETFYVANGKMTIGELIWRLLDNVGFLDYNIDQPDVESPMALNYFWVKPDKYVWEILSELADATQTAVYFDSYGILQIKTKEEAFKTTSTPVWTIRGETSGLELEDLVADSLQNERKDISNVITVNYKPVDFEKSANDNYISQMAWQPEGDVVMLRSSDLAANMLKTDTSFVLPQHEAKNWPYSGMCQIEGEVIEYDGKEYVYVDDTDNGVVKTARISSLSDYQMYYWKSNVNSQYRNYFTGRLFVKQRGMMNTYAADHKVGAYPYDFKTVQGNGAAAGVYGAYVTKPSGQSAFFRLQSSTYTPNERYHTATRGSTGGDAPNFYGTRFRIPATGNVQNTGGLVINATGTNMSGYYIEVQPSDRAGDWKEVYVYVRDGSGAALRIGNWTANIAKDVFYSLDVQLSRGDTNQDAGLGNKTHYIWVWLDGRLLGVAGVPAAWRRTNSDRFGMAVHGSSAIDYDYLYAFERREVGAEQFYGDDVSFYDRVLNGYYANQSLDDFTEKYRRARRRVGNKNEYFTQRYDTKFYDEFTPVVHEMRKYQVKFDDSLPGLAPKLIATNESQAKYINFRSTAFSAEFYAINASHDDINISGSYNGIDHSLGIAMQTLKQDDGDKVVIENPLSIRTSGRKDLEIVSDLIQSKEQATNIGEWIKGHWDDGTDEISVEIFGNTLLELTDIVYLNDPQTDRLMVKYFIIAASTTFDQGLSTQLRLRKVRV
jgi:hypothetical protein